MNLTRTLCFIRGLSRAYGPVFFIFTVNFVMPPAYGDILQENSIDKCENTLVKAPDIEDATSTEYGALIAAVQAKDAALAERLVLSWNASHLLSHPRHVSIISSYLVKLKMWDLALKITEMALDKFPENPTLQIRKVEILHNQEDYASLIEYTDTFDFELPIRILEPILFSYYRLGLLEKALNTSYEIIHNPGFESSSKKTKERIFMVTSKILTLLQSDIYTVNHFFDVIFKTTHSKAKWYIHYGLQQRRLKKFTESEESFLRAFAVEPLSSSYWNHRFSHTTTKKLVFVLVNIGMRREASHFAKQIRDPEWQLTPENIMAHRP